MIILQCVNYVQSLKWPCFWRSAVVLGVPWSTQLFFPLGQSIALLPQLPENLPRWPLIISFRHYFGLYNLYIIPLSEHKQAFPMMFNWIIARYFKMIAAWSTAVICERMSDWTPLITIHIGSVQNLKRILELLRHSLQQTTGMQTSITNKKTNVILPTLSIIRVMIIIFLNETEFAVSITLIHN